METTECQILQRSDVTARAFRHPESKDGAAAWETLHSGASNVFDALYEVLVTSRQLECALDPLYQDLIPSSQIVMLYGRKGSGKNTLLHAKKRVLINAFSHAWDFKLRSWNGTEFIEWCKAMIGTITNMDHPQGPRSLLIYIANLHQFNYLRSGEVVDAFIRLLTTIRFHRELCCRIRVVLTCDESPSQFPGEIMNLIDAKYVMLLPGPMDRVVMALESMALFKTLAQRHLPLLKWNIENNLDAVLNDPNHVLNMFAIQSTGATPKEIHEYLSRSYVMCNKPNANGTTEYGPELFDLLKYDVEGTACITPYNPITKNETIFKYARIVQEGQAAQIGTCTVSDNANVAPHIEDIDREGIIERDEEEEKRRTKRAKMVQPKAIQESIQERIKKQEEALQKAHKDTSLAEQRKRRK